ncbi:hypothetical protein JCM5350_003560 [Sporobolomyces pararoseus]
MLKALLAALLLFAHDDQAGLSLNGVPATTRTYWMRMASKAVGEIRGDPCSRYHFGAVVVNTTSNELVCISANQVSLTGNPTLHGEIAALNRCTEVLAERGLSPLEILDSWKDLSLYTTGEPCSMCSSAMRWAGLKEVIWATSIETVVRNGYPQIYLPSSAIVAASYSLPSHTAWYGNILSNETDIHFRHFFNESAPCPGEESGICERVKEEGEHVSHCASTQEWRAAWEGRQGKWEKEMMRTRGHPVDFDDSHSSHDEL